MWLAVPVQKTHKEQPFGIHNNRDHLVVYEIDKKPIRKKIEMKDQFDGRRLETTDRRFLCLPSIKTVLPAK